MNERKVWPGWDCTVDEAHEEYRQMREAIAVSCNMNTHEARKKSAEDWHQLWNAREENVSLAQTVAELQQANAVLNDENQVLADMLVTERKEHALTLSLISAALPPEYLAQTA